MNKPNTWLTFSNPNQWNDWLSQHQNETDVWIEIQKKNSKKVGIHLDEAVIEALCFGWIDSVMYSIDQDCFVLRMTPRKPHSPWSLINKNRALLLIEENRIQDRGYQAIEIAQANGWWDKAYTSLKL